MSKSGMYNAWNYTVEEAVEVIGISRNPTYDAMRRGEIPHLKFGRRIVIPKDALHRMLSDGRTRLTETAAP